MQKLPIRSKLSRETYGHRHSLITEKLIEKQINGVMTAQEVKEAIKSFQKSKILDFEIKQFCIIVLCTIHFPSLYYTSICYLNLII